MVNMCAKPGKILSPNRIMVLYSPSTLTVEERRRNRYRLKLAIRQAIDDMIGILESGDRKATTFLVGELDRMLARRYGHDDGAAEQLDSLRILTLFDKLLEHDSCQKAGKILSVPNMGRSISSPLAFTVEQRSHYWYMLKTAIIRSIDDMVEIVKSGDRKATTFLISGIERLFDGQSLDRGKKSGWAVSRKTDKCSAFYTILYLVSMCGKAGKIITTPKAVRVIHSASTLSVDSRSHYRYLLKLAIRRAVDDMIVILEGGDPKSAAFLRSELVRLDAVREKNGTARPEEQKDGDPAAAPGRLDTAGSGQPEGPEGGGSEAIEAPREADAGMDFEDSLWG